MAVPAAATVTDQPPRKGLDIGTAAALERTEGAVFADLFRLATPAEARAAGLFSIRSDTLSAIGTARHDVLALNRVVGLGVPGYATESMIDLLVERFRSAEVRRMFIQLSPFALPTNLESKLLDRGFVLHNRWAKLVRDVSMPPARSTDLRIERIGAQQAELFGDLVAPAFDWPPLLARLLARTVGTDGWIHYLAFDEDRPAAAAAVRIIGRDAYLGPAVTLEPFRGRGAQSALIARRIRDAAEAGCVRIVSETAEDLPERRSNSFHNLQRAGFQLAYLRPNYLLAL